MLKIGILGGSGYMGGEVLRILLDHPHVEIAWVTSRTGESIADYHPNLYGMHIPLIHLDETTPCDVVFLALPTDASIEAAVKFIKQGSKVIDLGAAFRLSNREMWEAAYQQRHSHWELVKEAVYGIVELHQEEIEKTNLVANPGCFSSAAILGLAPLVKAGLIDNQRIIVDGLSGTTGVGADLSRAVHHPEIGSNLVPYNVVGHRHTFEMEQELSLLAGETVSVHFTPTYVPIVRGILDTCHAFPKQKINRKDILQLFQEFYIEEPFVKIYDLPVEPNAP